MPSPVPRLGVPFPAMPALIAAAPPARRRPNAGSRAEAGGDRTLVERERQLFLVEDNRGDADLVREALANVPYRVRIAAAEDGEQAVAVLRAQAENGTVPDVILLDLSLPRMSGYEVLEWLKGDPSFRDVPVVVLTSSSAQDDNDRSYALGADDFVTKPLNVHDFFAALVATVRVWLESPGPAKRPPRS